MSRNEVKSRTTSKSPANKNEKPISRGERARQERYERLARPPPRRLRMLWEEKRNNLPIEYMDRLKGAMEEEFFMSPEQTEEYFRALEAQRSAQRTRTANAEARREREVRARELQQRRRWLVSFAAQVAYRLSEYAARARPDPIVSSRLRSVADVVLERVSEILGEPKPSRSDRCRLSRFMVAVSDRIAVWIEDVAYRAEAERVPSITTPAESPSRSSQMKPQNVK